MDTIKRWLFGEKTVFCVAVCVVASSAQLLAQRVSTVAPQRPQMLTLTQGRYPEVFPDDTLRRFGPVVYDMVAGRVVEVLSHPDSESVLFRGRVDEGERGTLNARPGNASRGEVDRVRVGRWLSLDPLASKYPGISPYAFVGNMPINAIDPNGKDIIVLNDLDGANGAGHQAVLIGDDVQGWTYVSKDGASEGAYGKPMFVVLHFNNLKEFTNSPHNFAVKEHTYHSIVGGGESATFEYKLDENGNKIQRFDLATRFFTNPETDQESIDAAVAVAQENYCLGTSDCTDVPWSAMGAAEHSDGGQFKLPSPNVGWIMGAIGKAVQKCPM